MFRRNREQPVKGPDTTNMNPGKHPGANHGKNRHGFGRPVNTRPPVLPEQKQNCRNQRSRVSDADPENKIDNRPAPIDRVVVSPDADPLEKQQSDQAAQDQGQRGGNRQQHIPDAGRLFAFGQIRHDIRYAIVIQTAGNQRRPTCGILEGIVDQGIHGDCHRIVSVDFLAGWVSGDRVLPVVR